MLWIDSLKQASARLRLTCSWAGFWLVRPRLLWRRLADARLDGACHDARPGASSVHSEGHGGEQADGRSHLCSADGWVSGCRR